MTDTARARFAVFSLKDVRQGEHKKTIWLRVGSAWQNRDGSINVFLDALPIDGRLHMRGDNEKPDPQQKLV